jgi:hypothetical protein
LNIISKCFCQFLKYKDPADSLRTKVETGLGNNGHGVSRGERTLDWWSGPLRQRITASKTYKSMDTLVTFIHIQTNLFERPTPPEEIAKELVNFGFKRRGALNHYFLWLVLFIFLHLGTFGLCRNMQRQWILT